MVGLEMIGLVLLMLLLLLLLLLLVEVVLCSHLAPEVHAVTVKTIRVTL